MAEVVVEFKGDAGDLTDALERVDSGANKAARALARLEKKERDAADKAERLRKEAKGVTAQLGGLKFAAEGAGGKLGEMSGRIEKAGQALSVFAANPAVAAAASIAALGAGAAIAGVAVVAAFVGITKAAIDAQKALEPFESLGLGLDAEDAEALKGAADAMDTLAAVADQLTAEIGVELAPAVEHAATVLVALGLASIDAFNYMIEGSDTAGRGLARLIEFGVHPLNAAFITFAELVRDTMNALGQSTGPLDDAIEGMNATQAAAGLFAGSVQLLSKETSLYGVQAKNMIAAMGDIEEATKKADDAFAAFLKTFKLKDAADEIRVIGEIWDPLANRLAGGWVEIEHSLAPAIEGFEQMGVVVSEGGRAFQGAAADANGMDEALSKALAHSTAMKTMAKSGQELNMVLGAGANAVSAFGDAYEAMGGKSTAVLKAVFIASKAAAMGDIIVKTAQSIMAALIIPPPAGPILAGINAATGALSLATVVATSFGGGGATQAAPPTTSPADLGGGGSSPAPAIIGGAHGGASAAPAGQQTRSASVQYDNRIFDVIAGDTYPGSAFDPMVSNGQRRRA